MKVIKNGSCTAGRKLSTYVLYNVLSWSLICSDDTRKYPLFGWVQTLNHWEYCGRQLKHRSTDVSELEKQANAVLDNICKATDKHFDFTEDKVLQAATPLDIKNFTTDKDALATFGNAEMEILIDHFEEIMLTKGCDTTKILGEWIRSQG